MPNIFFHGETSERKRFDVIELKLPFGFATTFYLFSIFIHFCHKLTLIIRA